MCPLQPCELPTSEGVWWRDTTCYRLYDAATAAKIKRAHAANPTDPSVDLGTIFSSEHPNGMRYTLNLSTMMQTSAGGFQRNVVIKDPIVKASAQSKSPRTAISVVPPGESEPRQVGLSVFYRDQHGCQVEFDPATSRYIIQQATQSSNLLSSRCSGLRCIRADTRESFTVVGENERTYTLRVRLSSKRPASGNGETNDDHVPFHPAKLEIQAETADTWLAARVLATPTLPSPEDKRLLSTCGKIRQYVYDNIQQWTPPGMQVAQMNPSLWDKKALVVKTFLQVAMSSAVRKHAPLDLRMAYHGTPSLHNVGSIFSNGLDPARRRPDLHGAYLANDAGTAIQYAQNTGAVLLFVLVSVAKMAVEHSSGIYIVPERITLPIAQLV